MPNIAITSVYSASLLLLRIDSNMREFNNGGSGKCDPRPLKKRIDFRNLLETLEKKTFHPRQGVIFINFYFWRIALHN
jgi:hypothetical protein